MSGKNTVKTILTLVVALCICLIAGYLGGYPPLSRMPAGDSVDLPIENILPGYPGLLAGQTPPLEEWYDSLARPVFSPPLWLFPPFWMGSFLLMGLTLFFILHTGIKSRDVTFGFILFISQALFTLLWAYAFFGLHSPFVALLCIIALFATLLCAIIEIFKFSPYGGILLIPYLVWVCWLSYFNYGVVLLNNSLFVLVI